MPALLVKQPIKDNCVIIVRTLAFFSCTQHVQHELGQMHACPKCKKTKFLVIIVWSFLFYSLYPYRFPSKLRSMCHCLFHVVNQRFQQSTGEAVWTVIGTVIFLRFINPAIGNVCRHLCSFLTSVYIFKLGECGIKDLNTFLLFLFSFFCQCCNSCLRVLLVVQCSLVWKVK